MTSRYLPSPEIEAFQVTKDLIEDFGFGRIEILPFNLRARVGFDSTKTKIIWHDVTVPGVGHARIGYWITRNCYGEMKIVSGKQFTPENFKLLP